MIWKLPMDSRLVHIAQIKADFEKNLENDTSFEVDVSENQLADLSTIQFLEALYNKAKQSGISIKLVGESQAINQQYREIGFNRQES